MSSPHCRESRHFSLGPLLTPANPITTDPYPIRTLIFTHFSQTHCPPSAHPWVHRHMQGQLTFTLSLLGPPGRDRGRKMAANSTEDRPS